MLLGINGEKGSGKDTVGTRLVELVEERGFQLSFARPLKESAAALLDIDVGAWETYKNDPEVKIHLSVGYRDHIVENDDASMYGSTAVEEPNVIRTFTAREFLQRYGTESHRDVFGQDFWVEQAMSDYFPAPGYYYYVTDCRFPNEAKAIIERGGVIIRIEGPETEEDSHASETPLADEYINFVIDNTQRDDAFVNLDRQLLSLAYQVGLRPIRSRVLELTGVA